MKLTTACMLSLTGATHTFVWQPSTANEAPEVAPVAEMDNQPLLEEIKRAELDSALLESVNNFTPPNPDFIFHNKMPKCGSTTIKYILDQLQVTNAFEMDYQAPCLHPPCNARSGDLGDGIGAKEALVEHVREAKPESGKYFLLKHQYYLNFTQYDHEQPTMINVVRDPVSRFSSMYYFNRYGFASMGSQARQGAHRHVWKGKDGDVEQTLDQCIQRQSDECMEPIQVMVRYFCGTSDECGMKGGGQGAFGAKNDWNKVARAAELAKYNVLNNYFAIGIMEEFDDSLHMFEKLLPRFFTGARDAYHSKGVQEKRASSSTAVKHGFNNETRAVMEAGPLRYEMDLYNMIKQVFNEKLKLLGIRSDE